MSSERSELNTEIATLCVDIVVAVDFGNSLLAACGSAACCCEIEEKQQSASATVHCDRIERQVQTPTVSQNS